MPKFSTAWTRASVEFRLFSENQLESFMEGSSCILRAVCRSRSAVRQPNNAVIGLGLEVGSIFRPNELL